MSERPFPERTIWRDSPLSHPFSASGSIYLWDLRWSESSLLTLESSLLFSLGRHQKISSSGGPFTMLSSAHTGALYLCSTYAGWVNENEEWVTQVFLGMVWKTLGAASCSLSYSLETEYLVEPEACIFSPQADLRSANSESSCLYSPRVGVTVVYGHTWLFACVLETWP